MPRPCPLPSAAIRGPLAALTRPRRGTGLGIAAIAGWGGRVRAGGGVGPWGGGRLGMGLTGCPPPAGQDQGPRPAGEEERGAAEAAGRPQGGAVTAAGGQGDGRSRLQAVQNVSAGADWGGGERGRGCCCCWCCCCCCARRRKRRDTDWLSRGRAAAGRSGLKCPPAAPLS